MQYSSRLLYSEGLYWHEKHKFNIAKASGKKKKKNGDAISKDRTFTKLPE